MTEDITEADLLVWANAHAPFGLPQARWVLVLIEQRDQARAELANAQRVCDSLAARVHAQSELLAARACRTPYVSRETSPPSDYQPQPELPQPVDTVSPPK